MSEIVNLNSLMNKMVSLQQDHIMHKAIKRGATMVRDTAVLLCPVDSGELRQSIHSMVKEKDDHVFGICYTNKEYAPYVEFGTGPRGAANHAGISPEVTPTYNSKGWAYMGDDGEWVYTNGQAAQPFMYPALKNNENRIVAEIRRYAKNEIERIVNQ